MILDDFIFADNTATPAGGFASPPLPRNRRGKPVAIPIKSRKEQQSHHFVPQSVPVPPHHQATHHQEFNYLNRHHRKTSIDDRRVSDILCQFSRSLNGKHRLPSARALSSVSLACQTIFTCLSSTTLASFPPLTLPALRSASALPTSPLRCRL